MIQVDYLIVGAGPTGIGAARRLLERGVRDFLVVEKSESFGGLAGSETDAAGYTWDFGCHVHHSHYALYDHALDEALGPGGWRWQTRQSWVQLRDRLIPYPFQSNIHRLAKADARVCLEGLRAAQRPGQSGLVLPSDFGEWMERTYGDGICELFMRPYNAKVWGERLDRLDWKWIGDRVPVPDVDSVERSMREGRDDTSWGPNHRFRYPETGGGGEVWQVLGRALPDELMCCGSAVVRVDLQRHRVELQSGDTIEYRNLITSMPVTRFTDLTGDDELIEVARGLTHRATLVIGLGLAGRAPDHLAQHCWGYYPDPDVPFYRATICSQISPANLPTGHDGWSLMLEIAEDPNNPADHDALVAQVSKSVGACGFIEGENQIEHVWSKQLDLGYPIPSLTRDALLTKLLPGLEAFDVFSRGRFGAWKYEVGNQDHSYMQGVEVIDRLLGHTEPDDGPEPTLNRPDYVNARYS